MRAVAFLRAINVTGRFVKMDALRGHFEALKCVDVQTFINSGNVIFSTRAKDQHALENKIEAHLHDALGFRTEAFVRSADELRAVLAAQPFATSMVKAAQDLNVGFVKAPLSAEQQAALMALKSAQDEFAVQGRHAVWLTRVSQHESKFSNAVFERKLKTVATWRRVSTLEKLLAEHFS
jgi:uncharacterized protein (DUF1697 family)